MPHATHLVFEVSGNRFALPADAVQEVILPPRLWQPPTRPTVLEGVLNLRGVAVPVLRLDRLLGLAQRRGGPFAPLIVLRRPAPAWAVATDTVEDVTGEAPLEAPADGAFNDCVEGWLPAARAHLLAPERLLSAREAAALAEFQAVADQRMEEWRRAVAGD